MSIKLEKVGPIYQEKQVKGYFMFYTYDKIDKKTNDYLLKILDEDLQPIGEKHITGSKQMFIEDAAYDNYNILIKIVDPAEYLIRYMLFDESANEIGKNDLVMDKKDFRVYMEMTRSGLLGENKIQAIPDVGFVSISSNKPDKAGYTMEFFSRQQGERKQWKYEGSEDEMNVYAAVIAGNKDQIFTLLLKRKNIATRLVEVFFQAHNTLTGKKLFEVPLRSGGTVMWPTNAFSDGGNILLAGAVFEDDDKLMKAKSKGLGLVAYNTAGKEIKKKIITWEEAGAKVKADAEVKEPTSIYFHDVVRKPDGNFLFIGESYRRTADAGGIVLNVLGAAMNGNAPVHNNTKVMIDDMVLLEITPQMALKNVHLFHKASSNAGLPATDFASLALLGNMAKSYGAFDYIDTQTDVENPNRFSVNYLDYDRLDEETKGGKTTYYGTIVYNNGKFTVDKIPLKSGRLGLQRVYPAKPGFTMMLNYNRKAKTIDLELIKVRN
ncbi:MAG: hypothetical protein MUF24_13345 [Chitinophagaceae bacterium]|nr:hypothetical protein [Chitinophagaceae bacterium]